MKILFIVVTIAFTVHLFNSIPDVIQYDRHYENQVSGGCSIDNCSLAFMARASNLEENYWGAWIEAGLE